MKKVKKAAKKRAVKKNKARRVGVRVSTGKAKIKRMSKKELNKYKTLLIKEREKIGVGLSHIAQDALKTSQREASGDLSGYSFHMADVASDNYEVEFSLGRAGEEQNVMYAIDEALKRVEDGSYGNCTICGKQIPKKRLSALPHTELCITCQAKNESK